MTSWDVKCEPQQGFKQGSNVSRFFFFFWPCRVACGILVPRTRALGSGSTES